MNTKKIKVVHGTIIQLEPGEHEVVVANGTLYVKWMTVEDIGLREVKSEDFGRLKVGDVVMVSGSRWRRDGLVKGVVKSIDGRGVMVYCQEVNETIKLEKEDKVYAK